MEDPQAWRAARGHAPLRAEGREQSQHRGGCTSGSPVVPKDKRPGSWQVLSTSQVGSLTEAAPPLVSGMFPGFKNTSLRPGRSCSAVSAPARGSKSCGFVSGQGHVPPCGPSPALVRVVWEAVHVSLSL
uniref:Uncharacterized protein n=1 Tax=Molossus molossus TaxID=27622 RepID=A0A7J8E2S9_MOLMO|nr:hypothetical protein HJG59_008957 [Molossus molossus]